PEARTRPLHDARPIDVRPEPAAKQTSEQENVDIRLHSVIYSAIEEIEAAMTGMLDPEFKEVVIGHAEIRNKFKINKNFIAGCMRSEEHTSELQSRENL